MEKRITKTFTGLFLEQFKKNPSNIAVYDIEGGYSYKVLNERSSYLATEILKRVEEKKCNKRIAVYLPRTKEYIVTLLAVLRSGCVMIPIDGEYPVMRAVSILESAESKIIITTNEHVNDFEGYLVINLDELLEDADFSIADTSFDVSKPEDEGFILFTSGSTGKPKGVIHSQAMLLVNNLVYRQTNSGDVIPHTLGIPGFNFVASLIDIVPPLSLGGNIYIANEVERKNVDMLHSIIERRGINEMFMTPQMYGVMNKIYKNVGLETVYLSGEKVDPSWLNGEGEWEFYGSTEAPGVLLHKAGSGSPGSLGKPFEGVSVYLIDEEGVVIHETGVIGEMCVSSPYIARGYIGLEEETKKRFVKNHENPNVVMFHTGDYMAYDENHDLIFHGRQDCMVKIRGYRVELGEVENTASKFPNVVKAAASVKNSTICLYYTSDGDVDEAQLAAFMGGKLAEYMLPGRFIRLKEMPLNPNGKLDRKALPEPDIFSGRQTDYEAPVNEMEMKLCNAFEKVIGLPANSVGRNDDFFSIGGDSLRAVEVMAMPGLEGVSVRMIFRHKTPSEIAAEFSLQKMEDLAEYEAKARTMYLPITSGQALMIDDLFENIHSTMYNLSGFFRLNANLDADRLAEAVDRTVAVHPGLCSVFDFDENGYILQHFQPGIVEPTIVQDVAPKELEALMATLKKPFRIFRTPLFRSKVFRCEGELYLFVDMLHLVSDGSSLNALYKDISRAYWGKSLSQDHFYSYVRQEAEIQGTVAFEKAKQYFADVLGDRNWCRIPTPDTDAWDTLCATKYAENVLTLEQMEKAEKRLGYSRNVIAIAAAMLSLQEYCGKDKIAIDYINNNRMERYLQDTVGLLYKTLPIAIDLKAFPTSERLLQEVNRQEIETFVYSVADYTAKEDLLAEDAIAINYVSSLGSAEYLEGFEATELPLEDGEEEAMGGHADLYISEQNGYISLQIDYLKNAYYESSIQRFMDIYIVHLKKLVEEQF